MSAPTLTAIPTPRRSPDAVVTAPAGRGRGGSAMLAPITYMRVVAAAAVIVFHAWQHGGSDGMADWAGGSFLTRMLVLMAAGGVDAFFVVTIFLSSRGLVRSMLGEGPQVGGRALLKRRAVGLVPVYFIAVGIVWSLTNPRLPGHWVDLLTHLTFTQVYSDQYIFWTLGPAWFIAVSMHFYVLLALLGRPMQAWGRRLATRTARVWALLSVAAVLAAISWTYKLVMHFGLHRPADSYSTWFGPVSRLDLVSLGLVLALISVVKPAMPRWGAWASWATALVLLVGTGVTFPEGGVDWWPHGTMGLAAFLYLLPSVCQRRVRTEQGVQRVAAGGRPPAMWAASIAALSYGVYIWQEPVLRLLDHMGLLPPASSGWAFPVTSVLMIIATLAVAFVSYHLLEKTGAAWASWSERAGGPRAAAPATAGAALAVGGATR